MDIRIFNNQIPEIRAIITHGFQDFLQEYDEGAATRTNGSNAAFTCNTKQRKYDTASIHTGRRFGLRGRYVIN